MTTFASLRRRSIWVCPETHSIARRRFHGNGKRPPLKRIGEYVPGTKSESSGSCIHAPDSGAGSVENAQRPPSPTNPFHSYPNTESAMLDRIVSWKLIVIFSVASVCWTYWLCHQPAQFQYESFVTGQSERTSIKQINTKTGETKLIWPIFN